MKALVAFRGLLFNQAKGFALALVLSLVALAAGVALLGTSGWFITAAALTTAGLAFNLFAPSALVRGFSFIRILARYGERLSGHDATLRLLSELRGWLFARLFPRLPLGDRSLRHGDLVSRLTADVDALDTAFLVAIGPITAALVIGATLTGVLAWLLPSAALVYGVCYGTGAVVVPLVLVLASGKAGRDVVARSADARAAVLDGIEGHADLVAFGVQDKARDGFAETARRVAAAKGRLSTVTAIAGFAVQSLAALALVAALWLGLEAFSAGTVDGPVLVGLLLAIAGSFEATSSIVRSVGKLTTAMAAAERLTAIAETQLPVVDPHHPTPMPEGYGLELTGVSFGYGGPPVLSELDLAVAPGEHVAITGPSGGGKSSLLTLLLRLADPQDGSVKLGGQPLAGLRQQDIHQQIATLSQDSPLFHDTIRANLLIGREDADEASLWQALDAADIGGFVRALPEGLDTLMGEGGRTVSVGQARRLCLARVLLSRAQILLLDEPTTGLDHTAEVAFFETLHQAAKGRTVLVVTHAMVPEGTMDRVLTMKAGRLG